MDWRDKAACLTADPELFFPVGNTGPAVDQIDKAKAVCGRCSVGFYPDPEHQPGLHISSPTHFLQAT